MSSNSSNNSSADEERIFEYLKEGVLWFFAPLLCILGIIEETHNLILTRQVGSIETMAITIFVGLLIADYSYAKTQFLKRRDQIKAGQSASGSILYSAPEQNLNFKKSLVLSIIVGVLTLWLSQVTSSNIFSLIGFLGAGIILQFLSNNVVSAQLLLGENGLWSTTLGIWNYREYKLFERAVITPDTKTDRFTTMLYFKARYRGRTRFINLALPYSAIHIIESRLPTEVQSDTPTIR